MRICLQTTRLMTRLAYREENDGISSDLESMFCRPNFVEVLSMHLCLVPNGHSCKTVSECY